MTWERALRASKLGAEQHNKGRLDMFTSPARFRQGGLFGWRFFKGKIECFVRGGDTFGGSGQCCFACAGRWVGRVFARDGQNSFCARACR